MHNAKATNLPHLKAQIVLTTAPRPKFRDLDISGTLENPSGANLSPREAEGRSNEGQGTKTAEKRPMGLSCGT